MSADGNYEHDLLTTVVMNGDDTMVWDGLPPDWAEDELVAMGGATTAGAGSRQHGVLGAVSGPSGVLARAGGWVTASMISFGSLVAAKVVVLLLVPVLELVARVLLSLVESVL